MTEFFEGSNLETFLGPGLQGLAVDFEYNADLDELTVTELCSGERSSLMVVTYDQAMSDSDSVGRLWRDVRDRASTELCALIDERIGAGAV